MDEKPIHIYHQRELSMVALSLAKIANLIRFVLCLVKQVLQSTGDHLTVSINSHDVMVDMYNIYLNHIHMLKILIMNYQKHTNQNPFFKYICKNTACT